MRRLLMLRNPRLLVVANLFAVFGDTALLLVLAIWIKAMTGSTAAAGGVYIAVVVPSALGPLLGSFIDRTSRRLLMILVNAVTALVVLFLVFVKNADDVWIMYAVAACFGLALVVFQGARAGLVVSTVPDDLLPQANAILRTSRQVLMLGSPLVGAGLYVGMGGRFVAIIVAAALLVSSSVLVFIREAEEDVTHGSKEDSEHSGRHGLIAGVEHIAHDGPVRVLVGALCISLLVAGFYELSLFGAIDQIGRQSAFMGVLATIQGTGALLGGITASTVLSRSGETRAVALGFVIQVVGIGVSMLPNVGALIGGVALFGLGLPYILVGSDTLVMRRTSHDLQGRTNVAVEAITSIPYTLSFAFATALIAAIDYRWLLGAMAIVTAGCSLLLTRSTTGPRDRDTVSAP